MGDTAWTTRMCFTGLNTYTFLWFFTDTIKYGWSHHLWERVTPPKITIAIFKMIAMDAVSSEATNYRNNDFNTAYVACEAIVAMLAVLGNSLVVFVFWKERRLRRRTNYYIVSLALADLLVGFLGIPFAILSSIGLPTNLHACLFTVSLLLVLCTISIFCLVAVSVDRYWAILHPMGYSRNVSTKTALGKLK